MSDDVTDPRAGVHLRSVNLNLLPILEALLSSRSVTQAASRLHMSQSAVSDALSRLRVQFKDELLVRSGREMFLTPLAQELLAPLGETLSRVEALVEAPTFRSQDLEREFVVATADPVTMTFGAPLCLTLEREAPLASVHFVDLTRRDYERLRGMDLDLVIVPRGFIRTERLIEWPIYEERFVCIARRGHPEVRGRIDRALYTKLPHVSYRADQETTVSMESRLIGLAQHDVIKVSSFSLLPLIVEQTDAIALVQQRVAERFAKTADIVISEPPVQIQPIEVCMYWSPAHEQDRAHAWFRDRLKTIAKTLG